MNTAVGRVWRRQAVLGANRIAGGDLRFVGMRDVAHAGNELVAGRVLHGLAAMDNRAVDDAGFLTHSGLPIRSTP